MSEENHLGGKVGLDVTEFKTGVSELGRQIRVIDSEFRASAAGMEDWGDSAEGLEKKVESLNKINELQRKKIEALSETYEKVVKEQGESSKAAQNMQIRINKETAALNKNQLELEQTSKKLEDFGKNTEKASKKTGKFKDALKKVGGGLKSIGGAVAKTAVGAIKGIGVAAGAAVTGIIALTESTREYRTDMAKFEQNVKDAGNSMEGMEQHLSRMTALTGESDSSIEALSNLMASGLSDDQMSGAIDALSGAVIKFPDTLKIESLADGLQETLATGKAVGPFAELIERMGGSLEDFDLAMEGATSQAEKQQVALEWLAKSGLPEVNEQYREANKEILSAAEAEFEMNDAMADLAAEAEPAIAILKSGVSDVLKNLVKIMTGASGSTEDFAASIKQLARDAMDQVKNVLPLLGVALESILPALIESIAEILPELANTAASLLTVLAESLVEALPLILPILINLIITIITLISQLLIDQGPMLIQVSMDAMMMLIDGLIQALPLLIQAAVVLFEAFLLKLVELYPELIPMAIELIRVVSMALIDALPILIEIAPEIILAIITALVDNFPLLLGVAIEILVAIASAIISNLGKLNEAAGKIMTAIKDGMLSMFVDTLAAVAKLITAIIEAIFQPDWAGTGMDIIDGIASGVKQAAKNLASSVKDAASSALDGAKNFLGIRSPSRVFRDEVGEQIGEGMAEGVRGSAKSVRKALNQVNGELKNGVNVGGSGAGTSVRGGNIYVEVPLTMDGRVISKNTSVVQYNRNRQKSRALGVVPV